MAWCRFAAALLKSLGGDRFLLVLFRSPILKALRAALGSLLDQVFPHELNDARVVVAIGKVVVQGGEAMLLAGVLHFRQGFAFEFVAFDGAPVVGGPIHGEAGRNRTVSADDHVVLAGAAVPFGEM